MANLQDLIATCTALSGVAPREILPSTRMEESTTESPWLGQSEPDRFHLSISVSTFLESDCRLTTKSSLFNSVVLTLAQLEQLHFHDEYTTSNVLTK